MAVCLFSIVDYQVMENEVIHKKQRTETIQRPADIVTSYGFNQAEGTLGTSYLKYKYPTHPFS